MKLITMLLIATLFINVYGNADTLNAGVTVGLSDTCQIGYETKGKVGAFAYCDDLQHFEDGSGIAFGVGYCLPLTPCAED